jgi:hypothetical protein
VVAIQGYNIYRKYRNASGRDVAIYIQNHIPLKLREDLMLKAFQVVWIHVHLPYPFCLESAIDHQVLTVSIWITCVKCMILLYLICDINREVYFLGDLNIIRLPSQEKASNCN